MTRIGLFGDVHGNLVALKTVLAALEKERPDRLVCLGDIASTGPHPHEVVECIRNLGCPVVMGNWDTWMVEAREGSCLLDDCREIDSWGAAQMSDADLTFLRSFPPVLEIPLNGQHALLCYHGSPRDFNDCIMPTTDDEDIEYMLDGRRALVMAGGHTHTSMLRRFAEGYIINPGSLSECWNSTAQPGRLLFSPWAEYGLVEWSEGRLGFAIRRVPIDVDAVIRSAFETGMAGADEWAATWLTTGGTT